MQTITKFLVLLTLSLTMQIINAQDTIQHENNKHKIKELKAIKAHLKDEEKFFLKTEVEAINLRLENGEITNVEAEKLKKKAAQKRALNIENRITIVDNKIQLIERNEAGYAVDNVEEIGKVGFVTGEVGSITSINMNVKKNKPKKYDLRTTNNLVLAFGFNNVIVEGDHLDNSPYKFGGSRFFEIGWAWKTRVFKNSNFLRLKYGYSFQINGLKPSNNKYFVQKDNQTVLEEFPENLKKSKLSITNLVFPLHFEFGPSTRLNKDSSFRYLTDNRFRFGLGGYAGFNIGSRQKLKYELDGRRVKDKQKKGFNTTNLVYGLSGYIAFDEVAVYFKYDLSPIFKDQTITQNNISVGIRLDLD